MKTAGMIGGLGPESTIDYYRSILARYRARKPGGSYPQIVINSLDVEKGIAMLDAGRLDDLADYLSAALRHWCAQARTLPLSLRILRTSCSMNSSGGQPSRSSALSVPPLTGPRRFA